jgi:hypothetical protein
MPHDVAFVTKAIGDSICSPVKPLLRTPANLPKVRRALTDRLSARPESRLVPWPVPSLRRSCHLAIWNHRPGQPRPLNFRAAFVTGNPERQALSMVFTGMLRRTNGVTGGALSGEKLPRFDPGMTAGSHWKSVKSGIWSPSFDPIGRRRFWMAR